ncbi:FecR family protein [Chitinophaga sp. 22536]|uniref:FecR family protein n=1 Tax=unclassified Chitinophaga TaxID=2619133 RepID=UPI003F8706BC
MNVAQLKRIINRYLAGNASGKETALIETWYGSALDEARQTPASPQSEVYRQEVLERLRLEMNEGPTGKVIRFSKMRSIAAACIVLLGGASLAWKYQYDILDAIDPVPLETVTARAFQVKQVVLPDSTVVVLNAGSEISYPRHFRGKKRQVRLNGEAFFTVTHNPSAAFTITAPHLQVQVLGTSFVMTDSSHVQAARVSVKTGRVAVSAETKGFPVTQLTANQELFYDEAGGVVNINRHHEADLGWTTKQLVFNNASLSEVFREIENLFKVKIQVSDTSIRQLKFTGAFDAGDPLPDMLKVIALSYRLTIQKHKDGTINISN